MLEVRRDFSRFPLSAVESVRSPPAIAVDVLGGQFDCAPVLDVEIGWPVEGGPHPEKGVKAPVDRSARQLPIPLIWIESVETQVPFTDHARVVAVSLEQLGQGDLFGFDETVIVPYRVASRQQAVARCNLS